MDRRLRRAVRVGLETGWSETVDRPDVDDPSRVVRGAGRLQQGEQLLDHEERSLHVDVEHAVPALLGKLLQRSPPRLTGVVDEDVELRLVFAELGGQSFGTSEAGQVRRDRDALAAVTLHQPICRGTARVSLAGTDVDLRAVGEEAGSDHLADAAGATGHECHLAADGEQVLDVHENSFRVARMMADCRSDDETGLDRVAAVRYDHEPHVDRPCSRRARSTRFPISLPSATDSRSHGRAAIG